MANKYIIYKIVNKRNNKIYVGRTKNFKARKTSHLSELKRGVHHNYLIQKDYDKHGKRVFEFSIIEKNVTHTKVSARESYHMNSLGALSPISGYNLRDENPGATPNPNKYTEQARRNMSRGTGEKNGSSKVSDHDVKSLLIYASMTDENFEDIRRWFNSSYQYDVSKAYVQKVCKREFRTNVKISRWHTSKLNKMNVKRSERKVQNTNLTELDVLYIRANCRMGFGGNVGKLAKKFNVNKETIRRIAKREVWNHI